MSRTISRKNVDYFEMFEKGMDIALRAAQKLQSAFADGAIDIDELHEIKSIEHEGDTHVHACLKAIDVAFITPIDRTDIVDIVKSIEALTDSVDEIANHIHILDIKNANRYLVEFVNSLVISCESLHTLMPMLKQFKKSPERILERIIEVNRVEEEGDKIYQNSMKELFATETDPVTIIKLKFMYEHLEAALDRCEDLADLIELVLVAKT